MPDANSEAEQEAADLEGQTLQGVWQIRRHIGVGAMGHVYEGHHTEDGPARVAVKVLHRALLSNREISYRFRREAEILETIESPYVPRIFDRGKDPQGRPFLVMELISGIELSRVLQARGTLEVGLALEIARQVCRALAAAHRSGIIHRDLKPDNVMLCGEGWSGDAPSASAGPPEVKLLDFSVSKIEDVAFTNAGALLGTPSYMPPEQARGENATPKVDVYAIGAVVYEMLTGRPPFDSPDPGKTLAMLLTEAAPTPRSLAPSIPEKVEAVILRALEKDPAKRYATASALEAEFSLAEMPDFAEEDAPPTTRAKPSGARSSRAAAPSGSAGALESIESARLRATAPPPSILGVATLAALGGGLVAVALTTLVWIWSDYAFPRWVAAPAWVLGAAAALLGVRRVARPG